MLLVCVTDYRRPSRWRPCTYTPEQQCAIIGFAVRKPSEFGLPMEKWSNQTQQALVRLVAQRIGFDADFGVKGKKGILTKERSDVQYDAWVRSEGTKALAPVSHLES